MDLASLLLEVQVISASGALAPGPLTFATIGCGGKGGFKEGLKVALGHMAVEFPLVLLLSLGLLYFLQLKEVKASIYLLGSAFLVYFAVSQFRSKPEGGGYRTENPFLIGASLSIFNPYFLMWWLAIGSVLLVDATSLLGLAGIPLVYLSHVWMDFAWLAILAHLGHLGRKLGKWFRYVNVALGVALLYFAFVFLTDFIRLVG
ncbi:MAG: LysE family transporter [Thaumarchaeota archaeon]|nr:LysE family transporter [Nitrososphaerota archaeon]